MRALRAPILVTLALGCVGESPPGELPDAGPGPTVDGGADALAPPGPDAAPPTGATRTVSPTEVDDVLYNPGMGFADFHFIDVSPTEHPATTVAYFRWSWAEVEPAEGQYDFAMVDDVIARARAKGETLAFRIMPHWQSSTPAWLLAKGVGSVTVPDGVFPDHNHPLFLEYMEKVIAAFGARYAGSTDIDHVDIGSVGCWGEWNTACCESQASTCDAYFPTEANQKQIVDWYIEHFQGTPLVALVGGQPEYAATHGAGWRGDCYGDYGMFGSGWNHMEDLYGPMADSAVVGNAWRTAPVEFEVCGVMQDWYDRGFDIDLILAKGLEWHMSVLNAKSSPVPAAWRPKVDAFLKQIGYRMVLVRLTHTEAAAPGGSLLLQGEWENRGVAPVYHPWPLAYRLRGAGDEVVAEWRSAADLRTWLPGAHATEDVVVVPAAAPAGVHALDVAVLDEDGARPHVHLAIAGERPDGWTPVSEVTIGAAP